MRRATSGYPHEGRPLPPHHAKRMEISVSNQQPTHAIDEAAVFSAVRAVLDDSPFSRGTISVAIVDDPTIHELNRRYLSHDWPTDVLSFVLEQTSEELEGEIVVSADTAFRQAFDYGWTPADELLLYVVHGMLHLVGFDDQSPADAQKMRLAETRYLARLGIERSEQQPEFEEAGSNSHATSQNGGPTRP